MRSRFGIVCDSLSAGGRRRGGKTAPEQGRGRERTNAPFRCRSNACHCLHRWSRHCFCHLNACHCLHCWYRRCFCHSNRRVRRWIHATAPAEGPCCALVAALRRASPKAQPEYLELRKHSKLMPGFLRLRRGHARLPQLRSSHFPRELPSRPRWTESRVCSYSQSGDPWGRKRSKNPC